MREKSSKRHEIPASIQAGDLRFGVGYTTKIRSVSLSFAPTVVCEFYSPVAGGEENRVVCRSLKRRSPAPVTSSWADINVGEP